MNTTAPFEIERPDGIRLVSSFADPAQLAELYQAVALGNRTPEEILAAFRNSRYTVFALHREQLVGAGRAFGDEVDCAVICDLAVKSDFQGAGLGGQLLETLKQNVRHHRRILLYASPGREPFYLKRGFFRMKTALISSYILPVELGRASGFIE